MNPEEKNELLEQIELRLKLEKLKPSTIDRYMIIAKKLPITRKELQKWLVAVGPNRHNFIRAVLKKFVGYGLVEEELLEGIKRLPTKPSVERPDQLITREELQLLINYAKSIKDKAIIAVLYESQARITEFLIIERKDVLPGKNCYHIIIPESKGDTGKVPIIEQQGHLKNWINDRGDHPGLFWFKRTDKTKTKYHLKSREELTLEDKKAMTDAFRGRLSDIKKRAGITKRIWTHLFRITSTTEKVRMGVPVPVVKKIGRWSKDSNTMEKSYLHLSDPDVTNAYLRQFGIVTEEDTTPKLKFCPRCKEPNPQLEDRCLVCGAILVLDYNRTSEEELYLQVFEQEEVREVIIKAFMDFKRKQKEQEKEEE